MTTLQARNESQAVSLVSPIPSGKEFTADTRFGPVTLAEDRLITFPQGLFGFEGRHTFGVATIPNQPASPMLLMHCTSRENTTFIVAAPEVIGLAYKKEDIDEALADIGFTPADTQVLLILTIYQLPDGFSITANMRAPVFVDTGTKLGTQYILPNPAYGTQQKVG